MRAKDAAAYVGEASVGSFRNSVRRGLYPQPIYVPGKGDRWLKEDLDQAIDRISGRSDLVKDAADLL
jgi:hypothetical protein